MTFVDFGEIFFFMKIVLLGERIIDIWKPGNQFPETAKSLVNGGSGMRGNRGGVTSFYPLFEHSGEKT